MAGATIVFCDIVGFSTNNIDRLRALISSLNADVTHELYVPFREAHSSRSVIILPTGDGMAITFVDPEDNRSWKSTMFSLVDRLMRWAKDHEPLRIGVHTGRVASMLDINGRMNICGTAINEAQRIMDAAHPNQVLLSEAAYHDYVNTPSRTYTDGPFSKDPAKFKGPHSLIVKHGQLIRAYIMYREGDLGWVQRPPYPREAIIGKLQRTEFIATQLDELCERKEAGVRVYEQSAFSTFGASEDESVWHATEEFDAAYMKAIIKQRRKFDQLARQPATELKLIINPDRRYDPRVMFARLTALLSWMKDPAIRNSKSIDWVKSSEQPENRLIVRDEFSIVGYKLRERSGYDLTLVYQMPAVNEELSGFEARFEEARRAGSTKESVIREVEALRKAFETARRSPTRVARAGRPA